MLPPEKPPSFASGIQPTLSWLHVKLLANGAVKSYIQCHEPEILG